MLFQLTSGIGAPRECTFAVGGIFEALKSEFPSIETVALMPARDKGCYRSVVFACEEDLSWLQGTILWVGNSPFRPHCRRKNWYIACHIIPDSEEMATSIDRRDIRIERFHSGGPGGQNVNKLETGIRLIHLPTGMTATSTSERSQSDNRRIAMARLSAMLKAREDGAKARRRHNAWRNHAALERGNPVRTYRGEGFKADG